MFPWELKIIIITAKTSGNLIAADLVGIRLTRLLDHLDLQLLPRRGDPALRARISILLAIVLFILLVIFPVILPV